MLFFGDALIRPGADVGPHMENEKRGVAALRESGLIKQLFRRVDGTGAVLIIEAPSAEAANQQLDKLPFLQLGLMDIPLTELEEL